MSVKEISLLSYMLKGLGRVISRHTRDMNVLNFPKAIVYEIYNSDGYMYIKYDKETKQTTVEPKRPSPCYDLYTAEPSKKDCLQ